MAGKAFGIEGTDMKEVYKTLDALPLVVKGAALRSIHRKGANIIKNEIKANSPTTSEEFNREIKVKSDKYNKSGVLVGSFDYRTNWFEHGTAIRQKKSGASTGQIQPKPFVERSFKNVIDKVNKFITDNYSAIITKYLQSYLKRQEKKLKAL